MSVVDTPGTNIPFKDPHWPFLLLPLPPFHHSALRKQTNLSYIYTTLSSIRRSLTCGIIWFPLSIDSTPATQVDTEPWVAFVLDSLPRDELENSMPVRSWGKFQVRHAVYYDELRA